MVQLITHIKEIMKHFFILLAAILLAANIKAQTIEFFQTCEGVNFCVQGDCLTGCSTLTVEWGINSEAIEESGNFVFVPYSMMQNGSVFLTTLLFNYCTDQYPICPQYVGPSFQGSFIIPPSTQYNEVIKSICETSDYLEAGQYIENQYFVLPNGQQCIERQTTVTIYEPLQGFDIGADIVSDDVYFCVDIEADLFQWNTGEDTQCIELDEPGEYCVTITVDGCNYSDCLLFDYPQQDAATIVAEVGIQIPSTRADNYYFFVPNVFSPNGDGTNDIFQAYTNQPNTFFSIFSRNGKLLFEGEKWDGQVNETSLPLGGNDTYIWKERYSGQSGSVHLLR